MLKEKKETTKPSEQNTVQKTEKCFAKQSTAPFKTDNFSL